MKTIFLFALFALLNMEAWPQSVQASGKSDWVRVRHPRIDDWFQSKPWFVGENADGVMRKTAQYYEIKPKRADAWSLILPEFDLPKLNSDFSVQVTVKHDQDLPSIAGLVLGADNRSNYITLRINNLGQFLLQQYVEGKELLTNKEYRPANVIRTNADNVLELRVVNGVLQAFINGTGVAVESYRSVTSSNIGLITTGMARFAGFTFRTLN